MADEHDVNDERLDGQEQAGDDEVCIFVRFGKTAYQICVPSHATYLLMLYLLMLRSRCH